MGKPALVIYREALQLLGLEASEVVAIGDSLVRCMCWRTANRWSVVQLQCNVHRIVLNKVPHNAGA